MRIFVNPKSKWLGRSVMVEAKLKPYNGPNITDFDQSTENYPRAIIYYTSKRSKERKTARILSENDPIPEDAPKYAKGLVKQAWEWINKNKK